MTSRQTKEIQDFDAIKLRERLRQIGMFLPAEEKDDEDEEGP